MNYFSVPGLIRPKIKDVTEILSCIEKAYGMPKNTIRNEKNTARKPIKNYRGVKLAEIRRALYVFLMDEVKMKSLKLEDALNVDHSSILKGAAKGRAFLQNKDEEFLTYYHFVKGIARGEAVVLPRLKQVKVVERGKRGSKQVLSLKQQSEVFEMWEQGTSALNLSRMYGVSDRTIYNIIDRCRNRLRIAV
jgi:hypothetical protein